MLIPFTTGHLALHRRGKLRAGETLLVHAGAGGVGSAAIQLGVIAGAQVIATAGGPDEGRSSARNSAPTSPSTTATSTCED